MRVIRDIVGCGATMPSYMLPDPGLPAPSYDAKRYGRSKHRKRVKHKLNARCVYHAKPDVDRFTDEESGGYPARSGMPCTVVGGANIPRDYIVEFEDRFRGIVYGEELTS